jgi:hypothetical protein
MFKATNCPITLAIGGLLPLTAAVLGPQTKLEIRKRHLEPLNTFAISVCAPGGGKSVAYDAIINSSLDHIHQEHGVSLGLETYTTAGLQQHQILTGGCGIITSDEGHRILAQINSKQSRNEAERALLCKCWGGKGDTTTLLEKSRGFSQTSLSMALYIQPEPFLRELSIMEGGDGFLERFAIFTCRPHLHVADEMDAAVLKLEKYPADLFPQFFSQLFVLHSGKDVRYKYTQQAQMCYCTLQDDHARAFNTLFSTNNGML